MSAIYRRWYPAAESEDEHEEFPKKKVEEKAKEILKPTLKGF